MIQTVTSYLRPPINYYRLVLFVAFHAHSIRVPRDSTAISLALLLLLELPDPHGFALSFVWSPTHWRS